MRVENALRGLALAGDVDLFCTVSEREDLASMTEAPPHVERVCIHHRKPFGPSARGMLRWFTSRWPRAVAWRDWDEAATALAAFATPPYDVVWYSACGTWLALGDPARGPAVVDLNDLEDEKLRTMRRLWRLQKRRPFSSRLRRSLGALLDAVDERRWTRAQLLTADTAAAVLVCSDLDRARLGHPAGVVVPNAYELPSDDVATERIPPAAPVFTTVGLLTYPPNADAAAYFAHDVLPLVRERVPSVRFRLVGRHDGGALALAELPGVELLGPVDDLDAVFESTTAVVVSLRAGGGTRIKILEAFARRLPVVSTSLGCEGLDARHGEELLVADTAPEFAAACVRLFEEPELARSLVERAHALWSSRFRAEKIRRQIRDLARDAAA
jgi:glycosyltransferase involved in cell wall biosynthesis